MKPTSSFTLYDASAGSGKTFMLVKEYLRIVLTAKRNDAYRSILAITFTNKAVHEMKSRILSSLYEFTKDCPSTKAIQLLEILSKETGLSAPAIQSKSQHVIKHLIHNYASFDISTIDKFTYKVIRAFAHDLDLPVTFEVTIDTDNLLREAVDAIVARAGEEESLTKLLIDFALERTDDDRSWDISREIMDIGKLMTNENNRAEVLQFKDKSIEDFIMLKRKLYEASKNLEKENKGLAETIFFLIHKNSIDVKSFSAGHFPNHLASIVEGRFNSKNKKYRETDDIKINKTAQDAAIIHSVIPESLLILNAIYKNYEKRDFYAAFLKNITPLSLLNTLSNQLLEIQEEQNTLSISQFNTIIHNEIQRQPAPFIYERIGERYRHFFIDEFQDTSEMQWQNLIPLIDNVISGENEAGQKGTLMIVGDPKQSIYRWRGGKAEQFIALSKDQNPFQNPDKEIVRLTQNFRSYSELISFNNCFFHFLANEFENADYKDLYENHSWQNPNSKEGGYVSIKFLPIAQGDAEEQEATDKTEQYCIETWNAIKKVKAEGFEFKDIAILTRKREQSVVLASYLAQQKIPILSSETLQIESSTAVQFLVHALKYLLNNFDLESKSRFLLFIGLECQVEIPLHDFIATGMALSNEPEFEKWLRSFGLSISFVDLRKKSLYEVVERLIRLFISPSNNNNAYVQYFQDVVLERDSFKQFGISDFINYWDKNAAKFSIPSPEGNNAVRMMTIHKSKGLEFPVVILPFAEEDYFRKPKDKLWVHSDEGPAELPSFLIDNSTAIEGYGEKAAALFRQKQQEELVDNINILYVALTRAEEQLYIISQEMHPKKNGEYASNMASFFIKYLIKAGLFNVGNLEYEFGYFKKLSPQTEASKTTKVIPKVKETFHLNNIKIAQREATMWGTYQKEAIEFGNSIHEVLSFIETEKDVESAIVKALENGLITENQREIVFKYIHEIVGHEKLQDFFKEGVQILNEKSIIQKGGDTIKPDRIVLQANNEVLLLDYKTGKHHAKHIVQLEQYQSVIEKMNLKVIKMTLVYIGEEVDVIHL